jgi:predicted lipoprotein
MKRFSAIGISILYLAMLSCASPEAEEDLDPTDFDERGLLVNVAHQILVPLYVDFHQQAESLASSTETYCSAIGTEDEVLRLSDAQDAWRASMDIWEQAELMLIGPASSDSHNLRDLIYSWPIVSECAVDLEIMAQVETGDSYDISTRLANRRGLDAVEYLLFTSNLDSACAPEVLPEGWQALSDVDKKAARCKFAATAAADLVQQSSTLIDTWNAAGDDIVRDIMMNDSSSSTHVAVNEVFRALFYLETTTKKQKIAEPAGISDNSCNATNAPCLEELESQHARVSKENVLANLDAFRALFFGVSAEGSDGLGFDDYLEVRGATDLVQAVSDSIDEAEAAVANIPGSMSEALESNYDTVSTAYDSVEQVTESLRTDIPEILKLEIPLEAGGDSD